MTNISETKCQSPWSELSPRNWLSIVVFACLICVTALGVHDVMLTKLNIPYPSTAAVPGWVKYADLTIRMISLIWLARISSPFLSRISLLRAAILLGIAYMCLNETLRVLSIYISLTEGWQHDQWLFTLMDRSPNALIWCFYGAAAAILAHRIQPKNSALLIDSVVAVGMAAATVAFGSFIFQPILERFAVHVEHILRLPDPVQIYFEPYPIQVNLVIYGTFLEATLAAFVLVSLLWAGLKGPPIYRICKCAIMLLLVRGRFISLFVFSFWVPERRGLAFLSESQFFLETLFLGILWGAVWAHILQRRSRPRS